jgi:DNA-binding response OmpR family regulator
MLNQGGHTDDASGGNILVVEDNELLAILLRRVLERAGYDVTLAASGAEMMTAIETDLPDLIVLDIGLPDADGRDLLAALKSAPRTLNIPVLVWSGRFPDSDRRIALELGAEDFVEKGAPSLVVAKIERVLLRISERELIKARSSLEREA